MPASDDLRGVFYAAATAAAFAVNDALAKSVMTRTSLAQVLAARGVMVSGLLAAAVSRRRQWRRPTHMLAVRTALDAAGSTAFLTALWHMPQANVTAIMQALPLCCVAVAASRGEHIGRAGWICVGVGLLGVLVIVRPGAGGFSQYSIFALLAVAIMTARDTLTRALPAAVPSLLVAQCAAVANTLVGAALLPRAGWKPLEARDWAALAAAALCIFCAYIGTVLTMRLGRSAVVRVAPLRWLLAPVPAAHSFSANRYNRRATPCCSGRRSPGTWALARCRTSSPCSEAGSLSQPAPGR